MHHASRRPSRSRRASTPVASVHVCGWSVGRSVGAQSTFNLITNEIFPERYRARGNALCVGLVELFTTVRSYLYPVTQEAVSMAQLLALLSLLTIGEAVVLWCFLPETELDPMPW